MMDMVTELYDVMQMGLSSLTEDASAFISSSGVGVTAAGVMGGSAYDDYTRTIADEAAGGGFLGGSSADAWTHDVDA
eukprot:scaffold362992_cov192-Cyclotella_meneghiniana.AAC.1